MSYTSLEMLSIHCGSEGMWLQQAELCSFPCLQGHFACGIMLRAASLYNCGENSHAANAPLCCQCPPHLAMAASPLKLLVCSSRRRHAAAACSAAWLSSRPTLCCNAGTGCPRNGCSGRFVGRV